MTTQVLDRIRRWSSDRDGLWAEVLARADCRKRVGVCEGKGSGGEDSGVWEGKGSGGGESGGEVKSGPNAQKKSIEKAAVAALRIGDVQKALRILQAAPLAPKNEATFAKLQKLHPAGKPPAPSQVFTAPTFSAELVKTALASFGPGSAAGLFGYRPSLLQQCVRAESFSFLRAVTAVVNQLASGRAPQFLQPFLAGGVSIALEKPNSGVRPCVVAIRFGDW